MTQVSQKNAAKWKLFQNLKGEKKAWFKCRFCDFKAYDDRNFDKSGGWGPDQGGRGGGGMGIA
jgi:hypothetical protein